LKIYGQAVSEELAGLNYGQGISRRLDRTHRHGAGLIQPQGRECLPHAEFLAWHRAEVFKEPARE
jgi:hypothetical protein